MISYGLSLAIAHYLFFHKIEISFRFLSHFLLAPLLGTILGLLMYKLTIVGSKERAYTMRMMTDDDEFIQAYDDEISLTLTFSQYLTFGFYTFLFSGLAPYFSLYCLSIFSNTILNYLPPPIRLLLSVISSISGITTFLIYAIFRGSWNRPAKEIYDNISSVKEKEHRLRLMARNMELERIEDSLRNPVVLPDENDEEEEFLPFHIPEDDEEDIFLAPNINEDSAQQDEPSIRPYEEPELDYLLITNEDKYLISESDYSDFSTDDAFLVIDEIKNDYFIGLGKSKRRFDLTPRGKIFLLNLLEAKGKLVDRDDLVSSLGIADGDYQSLRDARNDLFANGKNGPMELKPLLESVRNEGYKLNLTFKFLIFRQTLDSETH